VCVVVFIAVFPCFITRFFFSSFLSNLFPTDGEVSGPDELALFHIWVDANSNAHMDAGELKSLQQYNIEAFYTMHDCRKSMARLTNGTEILTEDLWFSRRRRRLSSSE
jgi:hypothetical protein